LRSDTERPYLLNEGNFDIQARLTWGTTDFAKRCHNSNFTSWHHKQGLSKQQQCG
jgi:hypothetical protein